MTRTVWCLGLAAVFACGAALAIKPAPPPPQDAGKPAAPAVASREADAAKSAPKTDQDVVDQAQKDAEAVSTGAHFTYDPVGRRDPFEPLIKNQAKDFKGKRPPGIAGMLVSEIALKGIAVDAVGSPVALFQGSDNRGYTLRTNGAVFDGKLISIDRRRGIVVFRQQIDDSRSIKNYRDVIKRLNPTGEPAATEEEGA